MTAPRAPLADLGRAIAFIRGHRHQTEVAAQAGISSATWSLYEAGRRRPSEPLLKRICKGLGCSRLELEETWWRLRRHRLLREHSPEAGLDAEDPLFAPDPVLLELRVLFVQIAPFLAKALLILARDGAQWRGSPVAASTDEEEPPAGSTSSVGRRNGP